MNGKGRGIKISVRQEPLGKGGKNLNGI